MNDLNGEEIAGNFYEKEFQKTNQEEFTIRQIYYMSSGKVMIAGLIKRILLNEIPWYKNESILS